MVSARIGFSLLAGLLMTQTLFGQNLDLQNSSSSGKHRGLAGGGLALAQGHTGVDLNPAGLEALTTIQLSVSAFETYHSYQLVNERKEEQLSRIFRWQKYQTALKNLQLSFPVGVGTGISLGFLNRATPYLYNQRRALTWSPLFNQLTTSNISTVMVAGGHRFSTQWSAGLTVFRYLGTLSSEIHGENHGNDTDKWATMDSRFSGNGLNLGFLYQTGQFRLGLTFEPALTLAIETDTANSSDELYSNLFPEYSNTEWKTPSQVGLGGAFFFGGQFSVVLDLVYQDYQPTVFQPNLYEYGGSPTWEDVLSLRLGLEWLAGGKTPPLRFGFARLPQIYASTIKTQIIDQDATVKAGAQNIKRLFTVGSGLEFGNSLLNVTLEHAVLTWHGDLFTYVQIEDAYTERGTTLFLEWIYSPSF